jgi:transposase-like protein
MSTSVKSSKMARRYGEDFKRQAVELMIHSGKTQRQVARELDISEYSLNLWKKAYLGQQALGEINGQMKGPEEMAEIIRQQHKEIEYLKRLTQHQGRFAAPGAPAWLRADRPTSGLLLDD